MKPHLPGLVLALFVVPYALTGQMSSDSLLAILNGIVDDRDKAAQLNTWLLGEAYTAFDNAVPLYAARRNIAVASGNFSQDAEATIDLINAANGTGQFALADSLSFAYADRAKETTDPILRVRLYHEAGKAAFFNQLYDRGIHFDTTALDAIEKIRDPSIQDSLTIAVLNYLGKSYNATGEFVPAATTLARGIDLLSSSRPAAPLLLEMYTELGIVYSQIGLYDRAVDYFNRSTGPNASAADVGGNHINIARNLILAGQYEAARDRYQRIFSLPFLDSQRGYYYCYAYNGLVEVYHHLEQPDSLNHYFEVYSGLMSENPDLEQTSGFLFQQSRFLHLLNNGRFPEAETLGQELYRGAIEKRDPAEQLQYTEFFATLYRIQGKYREAERYTRDLMVRKDSIQSANRSNALLLYYNQFETAEKEKEIIRLGAERERATASRRLFQTAAGFLTLLLLTGGFFFFKLRSARRKLAGQNLELNQLNATKDRFFGIIAHDLRNPIVALSSANFQVNRLYERGQTERVKAVVGQISQTTRQLNGLLNNLLQWAISSSGGIQLKRTSLSLTEVIEENFDLYAAAAEAKGIDLINNTPGDAFLLADREALQTILRNLIGNAIKFTPGGDGAEIKVNLATTSHENVITVTDSGPGLTAEQRTQLFKLHRGDGPAGRRNAGTGLGLILCKELAELHGGRIEVASEPGVGAQFSVVLPKI
ncbi:HAMP domain-containing sensor histidine kinase [Lewinella sp. 4G2]|uniref:ATP-binding protein n=1 Tax=Lewinella sp. 4G2 TaxID=1803372 RepID=UPI001E3582E4|nr:HAMP domain-containing sensor histidine kinase [Lewinella sp. 4G2]